MYNYSACSLVISTMSVLEIFEVKGKVAVVTGAASGIGLGITQKLLDEGAKVL